MSDDTPDKPPFVDGHCCMKNHGWNCPFCEGLYHTFIGNNVEPVPKITDVKVIEFFNETGYDAWTHAVCRGMNVRTHDELLKVGWEVFKEDETSILGLLEDRYKRAFQGELIQHQMKHRKREHFLIRDAWPVEKGFWEHL